MDFHTFKKLYQKYPIIPANDISKKMPRQQEFRNQLTRWKQKNLIVLLKRGMYLLNEEDRKITPSAYFIAKQLYAPSYISLETALSHYGLIPERVADITSVTTKKTNCFNNFMGNFVYRHIKPEAFRGFLLKKDDNHLSYFIATAEKCVVDFLYLNLDRFSAADKEVFKDSYRFQNLDSLKKTKLIAHARLFKNRRLLRMTKLFCEFIKEGTQP